MSTVEAGGAVMMDYSYVVLSLYHNWSLIILLSNFSFPPTYYDQETKVRPGDLNSMLSLILTCINSPDL